MLTVLFIGPQGSGKGTQAAMLNEALGKKDGLEGVLYVETGKQFRALAEEESFAGSQVRVALESGAMPPEFLPIWMWAQFLIENVTGTEHVVFDGAGRRATEARILDGALKFFDRKEVAVISLALSRDESLARLKARGRSDDDLDGINKRLDWYEEHVRDVLAFFDGDPFYHIHTINGEQSVEQVFSDITQALGIADTLQT